MGCGWSRTPRLHFHHRGDDLHRHLPACPRAPPSRRPDRLGSRSSSSPRSSAPCRPHRPPAAVLHRAVGAGSGDSSSSRRSTPEQRRHRRGDLHRPHLHHADVCPQAAMFSELFGTSVRYSGASRDIARLGVRRRAGPVHRRLPARHVAAFQPHSARHSQSSSDTQSCKAGTDASSSNAMVPGHRHDAIANELVPPSRHSAQQLPQCDSPSAIISRRRSAPGRHDVHEQRHRVRHGPLLLSPPSTRKSPKPYCIDTTRLAGEGARRPLQRPVVRRPSPASRFRRSCPVPEPAETTGFEVRHRSCVACS